MKSYEGESEPESKLVGSDVAVANWVFPVNLLIFVLIAWVGFVRCQPVPVTASTHDQSRFSAQRALVLLKLIFGDEIPHPAGSEQNRIVRERIINAFQSMGYIVQQQNGTGRVPRVLLNRSPVGTETPLVNLAVRRIGKTHDQAIMLVAHYDSVPFGAGIGDDASGAAVVLEIARMFADEPEPERDIIFLLTDGEELGMLGARLFVDTHPWRNDIGTVINLEARGTGGPSLMFQTSADSRRLVPLFAKSSPRPFSSSLFYEIYQRLPNDTDFTIFRRAGMEGYNFAFIGNPLAYHTLDDDLEHLDLRSLQHHGDNALGLVRELQTVSGNQKSAENTTPDQVVYFDIMGWRLFWWPTDWSIWFCLLLALAIPLIRLRKSLRGVYHTPPGILSQLLAPLAVGGLVVLVSVIGYLFVLIESFDAVPQPPWTDSPLPYLLGHWFSILTVYVFLGSLVLRRFSNWQVARSTLLIWAGLSAGTAIWFEGGCHLFLLPSAAGLMAFAMSAILKDHRAVYFAILLPFFSAILWLPLERLFYDAVGFKMPMITLARMVLIGSTLVPSIRLLSLKAAPVTALSLITLSVLAFVWARLAIS